MSDPTPNAIRPETVEALAQRFHEAYERLAPSFGYVTLLKTRVFNADSPNGKLMIAVCREIAAPSPPPSAGSAEERLKQFVIDAAKGELLGCDALDFVAELRSLRTENERLRAALTGTSAGAAAKG